MGCTIVQTPPDQLFRDEIVRLTPRLRLFARSLCHDATEAEDLLQDTLLKAWQHRAQYQSGTVLKAWLFTILRHRFIDDRRRSWRTCALDPQVAENSLFAVSDPDQALELDELRRALAALEVDQREAVLLVGAGGLAYEDAARVCGAKSGTMKSRVSRGRARLQELMIVGRHEADGESCADAMGLIFAQVARIRQRATAA